jgi:hypothetical protein
MSMPRKTARGALIAAFVAVLTIAFASVTGTAGATPTPTTCSADTSSSAANGSHIVLTTPSGSKTSSSSGQPSSSASASRSSFQFFVINGVVSIDSCSVSGRLVVQADGKRYCEASATHNGFTASDRDPDSGTATTCDAFASA